MGMKNTEFQGVKVSAWPDAPKEIAPEKPRKPQSTDLPATAAMLVRVNTDERSHDVNPGGILRGSCNRPAGFSAWGQSQDMRSLVEMLRAMKRELAKGADDL
jgi:hypothetical protein